MRSLLTTPIVVSAVMMHIISSIGMMPVRVTGRRCVRYGCVGAPYRILRRVVGHSHVTELAICGIWAVDFGGYRTGMVEPAIDGWGRLAHVRRWERIFTVQRRSLGSVSVSVPVTQVKSNKCACTVAPVAPVDLFGVVVQLVTIANL